MTKLKDRFTEDEINILRNKLKYKRQNAKSRGIECTLDMLDMYMLGSKLLGHGICDYTGMPFCKDAGGTDPRYPTIERIDDKKGYIRGNVCVVMQRANQLKDRLVDKMMAVVTSEPFDREVVKALIINMSKAHMEKLKALYIPPTEEEQEMDMKKHMAEVEDNHNTDYKELAEQHFHKQPPASEETTAPVEEKQKLPDDVAVALAYANYCKTFADVGMKVSVTYAQFKAKYVRNTCAMTGEKLSEEPKAILIMDLQVGFAKDNFIIVSKKMETAMTQLMIQTGMSLPKITAMLNKVV